MDIPLRPCSSLIRIRRLMVSGIFWFFATFQIVYAEDLLDIYSAAVENDPQYLADSLNYAASQEETAIARGALLPDVSLSLAHIRNRDELSGDVDFITEGSASFGSDEYSVSLIQPLFDRAKLENYKQAQLQVEKARTEFQVSTQKLITRVVNRYLAVLAAQDNLELAIAERKAVSRQLELAENRLDVGLGTITDLYDAQARYSLTQAREIQANNILDDAYRALWELIDRDITQLSTLKVDSPLPKPDPDQIDIWVEKARNNNLELIIAILDEEINKRELNRQKAEHLPSLNLILRHNQVDEDGSISGPGLKREGSEARLQLDVPLFKGGATSARSRQALLRYQAAQKRRESTYRSTSRTARSAFLDVTSSIEEVSALNQAVIASENALEGKQQEFAAGLNTNLDVLDAQRDLFRTKRDYLQARYQFILNRLRLSEVTGELDQNDLQEVNTWLN